VAELDKLDAREHARLMTCSVDVDVGSHLDAIADDNKARVKDDEAAG
jgi:hypothetical protein